MACDGIVFEQDKLCIYCHPHYSDSPATGALAADADRYQQQEDEYAAREVLGRLVVHKWPELPEPWQGRFSGWQEYLMFLYKPVAKHYGVDPDKVLASFIRHYTLSIMVSEKHKNGK